MEYKLLISSAAMMDLEDAYDWHERQSEGLGAELGRCFLKILPS
jgi:hypothetical protein